MDIHHSDVRRHLMQQAVLMDIHHSQVIQTIMENPHNEVKTPEETHPPRNVRLKCMVKTHKIL